MFFFTSLAVFALVSSLEILVLVLGTSTLVVSLIIWQALGASASLMSLEMGVGYSPYSVLLIFLVLINTHSCLLGLYSMSQLNLSLVMSFILLMVLALGFFTMTSGLGLYIIFEMSLVPIFFIIIGWGYQPERVRAGKAMFIYTVWGSLPLLVTILFQTSSGVSSLEMTSAGSGALAPVAMIPLLAFLVKMPLFLVHMWLPKAHVEAPAPGSMFLAAVLLKLGGYGLILFSCLSTSTMSRGLITAVGLWGSVVIALSCAQSLDVKRLIALSSVGHMSVAVAIMLSGYRVSMDAGLLVLLTHGFSSSLAFFISYMLYKSFSSRSLVLLKSSTSVSGMLVGVWYVTLLAVVGCPPSANLWVEMVVYMSFLADSGAAMKSLMLAALVSGVYMFIMLGSVGGGLDEVAKTPVVSSGVDISHAGYSSVLSILVTVLLASVVC